MDSVVEFGEGRVIIKIEIYSQYFLIEDVSISGRQVVTHKGKIKLM